MWLGGHKHRSSVNIQRRFRGSEKQNLRNEKKRKPAAFEVSRKELAALKRERKFKNMSEGTN